MHDTDLKEFAKLTRERYLLLLAAANRLGQDMDTEVMRGAAYIEAIREMEGFIEKKDLQFKIAYAIARMEECGIKVDWST